MKSIDAMLQTALESGTSQVPISRVDLFKTTFPAPGVGINLVYWRGQLDSTGDPYAGDPIDGSYDFLTGAVLLAEKGQAWGWWGSRSRPLSIPVEEDMLLRLEGYFHVPADSGGVQIEFGLVANATGAVFYGEADSAAYPSAAATVIIASTTQTKNTDQKDAATGTTTGWTADTWHTVRLDLPFVMGQYAKFSLLWRYVGETDWRLVDGSRVNVAPEWMEPDVTGNPASDALRLPLVMGLSGDDEEGKASTLTFRVPLRDAGDVAVSAYQWTPTYRVYGVLRPGRRVIAYSGLNTQGDGSDPVATDWIQRGEYFIDSVALTMTEDPQPRKVLTVTARDSRKKAAETPNLLYPDVLSYDLAGYSSDGIFLEPDGIQRYVAYDSWTLAEAVRDLLTHAGFTAEQLTAGIEENNVRLGRGKLFRLKLPGEVKEGDLQYAFEPGMRLLDIVQELAEKHGYRFTVRYDGSVVLAERNTGTRVPAGDGGITYSVGDFGALTEDIKGFGGVTRECTAVGGGTISFSATFAALYLVFHRATTDAGDFSLTVDTVPVTGWQAVDLTHGKAWSYRDGIDYEDGENPTVFAVRGFAAGSHDVVISVADGAVFGGYEALVADPDAVDLTIGEDRVLQVDVEQSDQGIRNDVLVVGREKGIDTRDMVQARVVDAASIGRPAARNFVGERRTLIIPDPSINDDELARYVAFLHLIRHRELTDAQSFVVPDMPHLELDDVVRIDSIIAGTKGGQGRIRKMSWSSAPSKASMTVQLNPHTPFPSFRNELEPVAPAAVVSGFAFARSDGVSITPSLRESTLDLSAAEYASRVAGVYTGQWAEEADAIFIRIDLNLWKRSIVSLAVKDLYTHRTVAILAEDDVYEWGGRVWLWKGRWYSPDHQTYFLFPRDPSMTDQRWDEYNDLPDQRNPDSADRNRSGLYYVEALVTPIETPAERAIWRGTNADVALDYGKVVLGEKAVIDSVDESDQPIYARRLVDLVPYGGRDDVYDDEWIASGGPAGVKIGITISGEEARLVFEGFLDLYLVYSETDWTMGAEFYYVPQKWGPESLARGQHLRLILDDGVSPWGTQLVAGETNFLDPGTYEFILDLTGLEVLPDASEKAIARRTFKGRLPYDIEAIVTSVPYRNDYLDMFHRLKGGREFVMAGWHFGTLIRAVNRAGESVKFPQYTLRMEDPDLAGNKHAVWPPEDFSAGNTTVRAGHWLRLRREKEQDSGAAVHLQKIAHLTSRSGNPTWMYDA